MSKRLSKWYCEKNTADKNVYQQTFIFSNDVQPLHWILLHESVWHTYNMHSGKHALKHQNNVSTGREKLKTIFTRCLEIVLENNNILLLSN